MGTPLLQLCLFVSLITALASAYQATVQQLPFFSPTQVVSWVFYASTLLTLSIAIRLFALSPLPPSPSPFGKIVGGVVWTLVGLFIYLWASRHSPYNPLDAMMAGGLENYVLKEPFYTVILLVAAGFGLLGIALFVLGLIDRAKLP